MIIVSCIRFFSTLESVYSGEVLFHPISFLDVLRIVKILIETKFVSMKIRANKLTLNIETINLYRVLDVNVQSTIHACVCMCVLVCTLGREWGGRLSDDIDAM